MQAPSKPCLPSALSGCIHGAVQVRLGDTPAYIPTRQLHLLMGWGQQPEEQGAGGLPAVWKALCPP